jgi:hypothetical protein
VPGLLGKNRLSQSYATAVALFFFHESLVLGCTELGVWQQERSKISVFADKLHLLQLHFMIECSNSKLYVNVIT